MGRKRARARASKNSRLENGIKLAMLGGAFTVLPWFMPTPVYRQALAGVTPIGLLLLVIGLAFVFFGTRSSRPHTMGRGEQSDRCFAQNSAFTPRNGTSPKVGPRLERSQVEASNRSSAPSLKSDRCSAQNSAFIPRNGTSPKVGPKLERSHVEASNVPSTPSLKLDSWNASVLDAIEWRRFEAVVERLYQQAGFETRSQSHGPDGGVDIWMHSRQVPDHPVGIVQCKHWRSKPVGVDKVRELRGVMAAHKVWRGQFATTSSFTDDARAFAKANGIHLIDRKALLHLIGQRTPEQQQELLNVALEGEYWKPTCASCGVKLVQRQSRQGAFWGCENYPRCRVTMA